MKSALIPLAGGLLLGAVAMGIGWFAARQTMPAAHEEEAPHEEDGELHLEPETLANLGVVVEPIATTTFVRSRELAAVVVDAPLSTRPLAAPWSGIVETVHVGDGDRVAAGAPVVTLLRDAIPPAPLSRTSEILAPLAERLHEGVAVLRTAAADVRIAEAELARLQGLRAGDAGLPVVAGQRLIDVENELVRARQRVENARLELERHGFDVALTDGVESGAAPAHGPQLWRHVLAHNGLWSTLANELFAALPEPMQERHGTVAQIGELVGAGLVTDELVAAVRAQPTLAQHFPSTSSLLLAGHSPTKVAALGAAGALASRVVVRAPAGGDGAPTDYDIAAVRVRLGDHVAIGHELATLHDARTMRLRIEANGGDVALLAAVLADARTLTAEPTIVGGGPTLADLRLERIAADDAARGSAIGIVTTNNTPLSTTDGPRSWALRAGIRYRVRVPVTTVDDVFVLPRDAVAAVGADQCVFVSHGDHFHPEPVRVLHIDRERVVLAPSDHLKPGAKLAVRGAFALAQAMQKDAGGGHDHHGHDH